MSCPLPNNSPPFNVDLALIKYTPNPWVPLPIPIPTTNWDVFQPRVPLPMRSFDNYLNIGMTDGEGPERAWAYAW